MRLRSAYFIALGASYVCVLCGQQPTEFQGSVPTGTLQPNPLALTLRDAIQRALEANLGLLTRSNTSLTVRAARVRALSALLPQVTGTVGETDEQINLKTVGINFQFP